MKANIMTGYHDNKSYLTQLIHLKKEVLQLQDGDCLFS